jgi:predicted nucleic acid-binding protein
VILVDTSIWIAHFRRTDVRLVQTLHNGDAGLHRFILGEIAAGNLRDRARTLADLALLPRVSPAQESEVHHLLESRRLWGAGLGWVDLHILASAILSSWALYTADRAMHAAAARLNIELISN